LHANRFRISVECACVRNQQGACWAGLHIEGAGREVRGWGGVGWGGGGAAACRGRTRHAVEAGRRETAEELL
jgi:hypothetical protein